MVSLHRARQWQIVSVVQANGFDTAAIAHFHGSNGLTTLGDQQKN
jgi:hypothetical protein